MGAMDRAAVAAIAALDDDVRRALYEHVRAAGAPVTREEAATAVGISRKLAAFHLDKLVDLGVLRSGFGPATGPAGGPGAAPLRAGRGRHRGPGARAEPGAAGLDPGRGGDHRARRRARRGRPCCGWPGERGAALGAAERARLRGGRVGAERALATSAELLARQGFEPFREDGSVRLRSCPFHPMAGMAPALVCGLNRAYLAGMVEGLDADDRVAAELAPARRRVLRGAALPS